MSRIFLHGVGAVSPAGWGVGPLFDAVRTGVPLPLQSLARPGLPVPLLVRRVPAPEPRPAFLAHPRLRRTSSISHFAVGAAVEALGEDPARIATGELRLGIIFCAFTGCVGYSRRFYDEVLREPATASPLIFPETVFNAPASHLAAFFGTSAVTYTLVGDQGECVKALALAADWLSAGTVDGCLVVGAEESDWLSAEAFELLGPGVPSAEGAGAIYLRREPTGVELVAVTEPQLFTNALGRTGAIRRTRRQLEDLGISGGLRIQGNSTVTEAMPNVYCPDSILGDGFGAAGAWQLVFAAACLSRLEFPHAVVETVGSNEQAVAAVFCRS